MIYSEPIVPFTDYEDAKRNRERLELLRKQKNNNITLTAPIAIASLEPSLTPIRQNKQTRYSVFHKGRPRNGELRNCATCGKQIYIKRNKLIKTPNTPRYCKDCWIKEHPPLTQYKPNGNNIETALKCLASADKKYPHTWDELFNMGAKIVCRYLGNDPLRTVKLLTDKEQFTIDDLLKGMTTIIVRQTLKINDEFIEISPDTWQLKNYSLRP